MLLLSQKEALSAHLFLLVGESLSNPNQCGPSRIRTCSPGLRTEPKRADPAQRKLYLELWLLKRMKHFFEQTPSFSETYTNSEAQV